MNIGGFLYDILSILIFLVENFVDGKNVVNISILYSCVNR